MQHQIMFTAHDAGHRGITHNFIADTLIGIFIADFCCGLSIGWWKSSHNVHHLVTNHPVSTYGRQGMLSHLITDTGTRPRHSKRATIRNLPILLSLSPFHILQLHLQMGRLRQPRHNIPSLHLLPRHGHSPLQPLPSLLASPDIFSLHQPRLCSLDTASRNTGNAMLLVPFRLLPAIS